MTTTANKIAALRERMQKPGDPAAAKAATMQNKGKPAKPVAVPLDLTAANDQVLKLRAKVEAVDNQPLRNS